MPLHFLFSATIGKGIILAVSLIGLLFGQQALAATVTLSGSVDISTAVPDGFETVPFFNDVVLVVGTSTPSIHRTNTAFSADFSFSINDGGGYGTGTPFIIFVDGNINIKGTLVSKASSTSNITGLTLFEDRVTVRHQAATGTSTSLTDMVFYDSTDDSDVGYIASSTLDSLQVLSNNEFYISGGTTFVSPISTTFNGSFKNDGIFDSGSSDIVFQTPVFTVAEARYVDDISVALEDTAPSAVFFSPGGTSMFVLGDTGNDVNEYTLTAAFDVSTATFVRNLSVSSEGTNPTGLAFNTIGTSMYVVDGVTAAITPYLFESSDFELSGEVFVGSSFSVAAQETNPTGLAFSSDGTKMFVVGTAGDDVNEYTLSTAFNVSTATFVDSFSVAAQETAPSDIAFNNSGTKMYVLGDAGNDVNEYALATAFDVSTATFVDNLSVAARETAPTGIAFNSVDTKMFIVGSSADRVDEYAIRRTHEHALSGSMTGSSTFDNVTVDSQLPVVFEAAASTSDLTITSGSVLTAPAQLTINGEYTNNGTFNNNNGTVYFSGLGSFDVSTASFINNFSISAQESRPEGIAFNPGGTKMFVVGSSGNDVNEYTLATAFDVSTATFVDSFSVAAQETSPRGLAFSADGTKMFVIGTTGDDVNEYTLATAFDVSTATFVDSFSIVAQEVDPEGVTFNLSGTKMFVIGTTGDDVNEYTLSTAYDVSTATFVDSFSVANEEASPEDLAFSADGSKMFVVGGGDESVVSYEVTATHSGNMVSASAFNNVELQSRRQNFAALASTTDLTIHVGAALFAPAQLSIAGDYVNDGILTANEGTIYMSGNNTTMSGTMTGADTFSTLAISGSVTVVDNASTTNLSILSGGSFVAPSLLSLSGNYTNGGTFDKDLGAIMITTTAFTPSAAVYTDSFSVSAEDTSPRGLVFSSDGTKLFVVGDAGNDVNEYTLATAFDVSTATFVDSFSVALQETSPLGLVFNSAGTKMFVVGSASDSVHEYVLSPAYDVSTATFVDSFSVAGQETSPTDVAFSADGAKMFVVGTIGDDVNEYTLTTAFDVSTATFVDSFSVAAQETSPEGLTFNPSGTKMFVIGFDLFAGGADAHKYKLNAPFDVSTATFVETFSVAAQETTPRGITFKPDGTQMFVVGSGEDSVHEYSLSRSTTNVLAGSMTGSSGFGDLSITSSLPVSFAAAASTDDFTTSSESIVALPRSFEIAGNFVNDGSLVADFGTITLTGTNKTLSGALVGANSLASLIIEGSITAADNASTSDVIISSGGSFTAPALLSITDDFSNNGDFVAGDGTVYFSGENDIRLEKFVFNGDDFLVTTEETGAFGLTFSPDGSKMYVVGAGNKVNEYDLSSAFNVSSASFVHATSVASQQPGLRDVAFNPDGSKMYIIGSSIDRVHEYNLTTNFDVSTANYNSIFLTLSINDTYQSLSFNNDGTKLYVYGFNRKLIFAYDLSVPYDMSTGSYNSENLFVGGEDTNTYGSTINSDGTKVYTAGLGTDTIFVYNLGTPFDLDTGEYNGEFYNVEPQEVSVFDVAISPDSKKVITVGPNSDLVSVFELDELQQVSGSLVDDNALGNVSAIGILPVALTSVASTTDLAIGVGATLIAPDKLSIMGDYSNEGTFVASTSEVTFAGTVAQTATGTMTGASQFYDLTIANTSGTGDASQSVTFAAPVTATNTLTMIASSSVAFLANATSTFTNIDWRGTEASPVWLRSSIAGTQWYLDVPGSQINVQYVHVADSNASSSRGGLVTALSSVDDGNNSNWNFTVPTALEWNASDWTLYDTITIDSSSISSELTDFPVYVNLADLSADFWNTTPSSAQLVGTDIRITTDGSSPIELPRELVSASSGAETGELHFRADSISATQDTVFRIYYNGSIAGDYAASATYGAQNVWTNGYVAVYHLQDTDITDSTGNGNDGVNNGATATTGQVGGSLAFDGATQYASLSTLSDLVGAEKVTVTSWFSNDDAPSGFENIIGQFDGTEGWLLHTSNLNGNAQVLLVGSGTSYYGINTAPIASFAQMGFVYDGSQTGDSNRLKPIVDGQIVVADAHAGGAIPAVFPDATSVAAEIGRLHSGLGRFFDGKIDEVRIATTTRTAAWLAAEYSNQSATTNFYAVNFVPSAGASVIADHDDTQVNNNFDFQNKTDEALFAFKLNPQDGEATVTDLTITLSGVEEIDAANFSNIRLYRDHDADAAYDVTDTQVGGAGVMSLVGRNGTITFTGDFLATSSENFVLIADWNAPVNGSFLNFNLYPAGLTIVDNVGMQSVSGTVRNVQHNRNNKGSSGGGGSGGGFITAAIGEPAPPGQATTTGGTNDGGQQIGDNPDFKRPTAHSGGWSGGANAYDRVDGTYATDDSNATSTFTGHTFVVPGSNTITGIEVKLEVSGTTAAGSIGVELSYDGGNSWTAVKTTPTLTTIDTVVTLGGASDLWGRVWTQSEFSNANFAVRLTANSVSNTVQVDAIQVRVYHQAGGGGAGGGGPI